jgi:predicted Zn-dependent protease
MRVRTFLGVLLALVAVVVVSCLYNLNLALLTSTFALSSARAVPLYFVVLAVFLLGFIPTVSVLLAQTLRRDLAERRARRRSREARSLEGSFRRALDYRADDQWERAALELEGVLADRPEDFSALLLYGDVLRRRGRSEEALEVHRRASVLYPRSVAVLYQLADDYEAHGEPDVARQIRDRILRDFSGLGLRILRVRRNKALSVSDWKQASAFQERIETLIRENESAAELVEEGSVEMGLNYQKAIRDLEGDRLEEAKGRLDEILDQEPRFVPALILRGEAELLRRNEPGAVDAWRHGFELTGSPVFLQRIEDHFIERENPLEAIETLHGLISSSENGVLPRFFLGRLYYRLEMHEDALKVLEALPEEVSSSPTYHFLLGRIHQRRGEAAKAVESYVACIQEAGITAAEFTCVACGSSYPDWRDRCEDCGSWNSVELDFELEGFSAEELGLRGAPIRAIREPES